MHSAQCGSFYLKDERTETTIHALKLSCNLLNRSLVRAFYVLRFPRPRMHAVGRQLLERLLGSRRSSLYNGSSFHMV